MGRMTKAGRRGAGANTREELLEAAAGLTVARGMAPVSLREIAEAARVTPAMVRYHFGDKDGLMRALMDHGFAGLFDAVPAEAGFAETVAALARWMQAHPWLVQLMTRSVYAGSELRAHFEAEHAPRLAALYAGALERGRQAGEVRDDLEPGFAISALVSLLVFRTLAGPSLGRVLGDGGDAAAAERFARNVRQLFRPLGDFE